ncbi:MAG: hypothetical protein HY835_14510, partial [Anaerolineae bacterium]|nr:hypothetical protein [Anaerolineae bacterium]
MKKGFQIFIGVAWIISAAACQAQAAPQSMDPTAGPEALATPIQETLASVPAQDQQAETGAPSTTGKLAEISARVGYTVREPAVLPDGYTLAEVSVDEPTRSVCLQYRHAEAQDVILLIAQGPKAGASALAEVSGWPDYALTREAVELAGASQAEHLLGWRRASWGCSGIAESTNSPYSFALAPRYSWDMGDQVFEIYSASGGCATTGGVTNLDLLRMAEGLTGQSALAADALDPECLMSIADAEKLAGFDIKEPTYLPQDVAFYYAAL